MSGQDLMATLLTAECASDIDKPSLSLRATTMPHPVRGITPTATVKHLHTTRGASAERSGA
jgi:hypothetical protein